MAGVQELRTTSPGGSARQYLAGAFVGALILLGCSVFVGWPVVGVNPNDPASIAANAAVGTCVTWTKSDESDLREVDCGQQHLFEVTGTADISGSYPSGAAMPAIPTWQRVTQSSCASSATAYLGKLDPNGRYMISALLPTKSQWDDDDRSLRCGLQSSTPLGQPLSTAGTAKGQDQSGVYPVGTCLALNGKVPGGPTSCGSQHAYEIVGIVDLHAKFPTGYPSSDQQASQLGQLCKTAANNYTNDFNLDTNHLTITWNTIKQESWAAGSYKTNCEIAKPLPDGSGLDGIVNSVKGVGPGSTGGG